MQIIRGLHNLTSVCKNAVITIGNFDGVHLGHQAVLQQLRQKGEELNLPTLLMTFEPHPKEFFQPDTAMPRLSNFREKMLLLDAVGLENVLVLDFNQTLAKLSADEFIQKVLLDRLAVKHILIGEDFRFGYRREGDLALLRQYAVNYGFTVDTLSHVMLGEKRISSSYIRECLAKGDFKQAKNLLGYTYFIAGRVARGDQRGRTIGFPTLNIPLKRLHSAIRGVFAVTVTGIEDRPLKGVANLGTRPTVDGLKTLLEVHLFDFDKMIYGQHVKVHFHEKIRDEKKFGSFEELKQQIIKDVEMARELID